jgi:hypothetical protein
MSGSESGGSSTLHGYTSHRTDTDGAEARKLKAESECRYHI